MHKLAAAFLLCSLACAQTPGHPATEPGVPVLLLSAPVEVIDSRGTMRRLLSCLHNPYLVLRFAPPTGRRPTHPNAPRATSRLGHRMARADSGSLSLRLGHTRLRAQDG